MCDSLTQVPATGIQPRRTYGGADGIRHLAAAHAAVGEAGVTLVDRPHMIFRDDEGRFGAPGTEVWQAAFRDSEDNLVVLEEDRPPA